MLPRRELRALVPVAVLAAAVVLAQAVTGLEAGVLHLAPALLLLAPLLLGRYVGEERLAALATQRRNGRPRAARQLSARIGRAVRVTVPRGGALLAAALAERGPPAVTAVTP